mgnify:CR=1 FL=1
MRVAAGASFDTETEPTINVTVTATSTDGSTSQQAFAIAVNDVDEFDVTAVTDTDATANAIDRLPPELVRKGRFDELFFVDLPDAAVRAEIFRIHLGRRELDASGFDLDLLAVASEGFSGAEIEQVVVSALYAAQAQQQAVDQLLLLQAIQGTAPLSVVMAEGLAALRAWASGRTVNANG